MTQAVLRKSVYFNVPPARVWAFLTEPDLLAQWFHAPREMLKEGAKLEMFGTESGDLLIWGEVITARAPEVLEYTFTVKPMGDAVSTVRWTLSPAGDGGTHLALEHTGLPQAAEAFGLILALDKGWDNHLMSLRTAAMPSDA